MTAHKPLLRQVLAEKRIVGVERRDFNADPWMRGEGAKFWTVERIATLKAENEKLRKARK